MPTVNAIRANSPGALRHLEALAQYGKASMPIAAANATANAISATLFAQACPDSARFGKI
jgi:hypothetical protein